ncbi:hypothetical protein OAX78_03745, partial [Planctomycetota bacterium]|nr:hypothetical protein [Planctomycetota bacterium]
QAVPAGYVRVSLTRSGANPDELGFSWNYVGFAFPRGRVQAVDQGHASYLCGPLPSGLVELSVAGPTHTTAVDRSGTHGSAVVHVRENAVTNAGIEFVA